MSISKINVGGTEHEIDAASADKLNANAGSATNPVYFSGGVPVKTTYTLGKSVPSDAVFTDTNTKVTAVGNHYTPSADSSAALSADASSTTSATWGSTDLVTGVNIQRDAKGHVTGVTVDSIQMPANPNTDTHYTTGLKVGASATATANAAASNGSVYLNVLDNTTVRDSHKIVGSGATTVTSDDNGVITISSTDNNTVYTHPSYTARTGKPTANQTPAFGGTATVSQITSDATGHVTGATDRTITIPSTLSNGTGTAGLIKTSSTVTSNSGYTACPVISGVPYYKNTNTTYSNFVKSGSGAKAGLVPAPSTTAGTTKYLREDGTWAVPPDTNTTYSLSSFGITATATELNYCDGVTSNIQTQLNNKVSYGSQPYLGGVYIGSSTSSTPLIYSEDDDINFRYATSAGGDYAYTSIASLVSLAKSCYSAGTSRAANTVLAAPNGSAGGATFRKLVAADLPSHGRHVPDACATITDWNNATTTGWYMASGASNAPDTSNWYMGLVFCHNQKYIYQEVVAFVQSITTMSRYKRVCNNGTWSSWVNISDNNPTGTYTGNGSATSRTIVTGGTGKLCIVYSGTSLMYAATPGCIGFTPSSTTSSEPTATVKLNTAVKYTNGTLTIATTSSYANTSGSTYTYICI